MPQVRVGGGDSLAPSQLGWIAGRRPLREPYHASRCLLGGWGYCLGRDVHRGGGAWGTEESCRSPHRPDWLNLFSRQIVLNPQTIQGLPSCPTLAGCFPVGLGAARNGKMHGVETCRVPYTVTPWRGAAIAFAGFNQCVRNTLSFPWSSGRGLQGGEFRFRVWTGSDGRGRHTFHKQTPALSTGLGGRGKVEGGGAVGVARRLVRFVLRLARGLARRSLISGGLTGLSQWCHLLPSPLAFGPEP